MMPTRHALISGGLGLGLFFLLKSWGAFWACTLSGVFIDLDHHLDYLLATRELPLSYKKLVRFCSGMGKSKLFLILHSYELILTLWLCIIVYQLNAVWFGIAVGLSSHVVCDLIVNPLKPMAYFFLFRLRRGFERENLFTEEYFKEVV